jgi:hypothetical protein
MIFALFWNSFCPSPSLIFFCFSSFSCVTLFFVCVCNRGGRIAEYYASLPFMKSTGPCKSLVQVRATEDGSLFTCLYLIRECSILWRKDSAMLYMYPDVFCRDFFFLSKFVVLPCMDSDVNWFRKIETICFPFSIGMTTIWFVMPLSFIHLSFTISEGPVVGSFFF